MFTIRIIAAAFCAGAWATIPRAAVAQQRPPRDTTMAGMSMRTRDTTQHAAPMSNAPLGISMERMGSGTTWIPDAVSLPARHFMAGSWDLMLHGFVFAQYDKQDGARGASQAGSLNWGMLMASRAFAGGRFQARTMLSLDPATVTRRGYPLLLQSGESLDGAPIHDRQHPHDFWMELGVLYERPVTTHVGVSFYAAPSGEPALGPVAFMHRPSAMDIPFAPLGHHWQDATHIAFGVLTAGVFTRAWKLEGSAFNGREPDDKRWNFDRLTLDSYAGRLTINPETQWSLSAGYGSLKSPDALAPDESIHRVSASIQHGAVLGADGQWASALIYGSNRVSTRPGQSQSLLLESEAILDRLNTLMGRVEYSQKSAEDLVLDAPPFGLPPRQRFGLTSASLGYIRELVRQRGATIGVGVMGTVNMVPPVLESPYGSRAPLGGVVFLRLRPFHARGKAMRDMEHMRMEESTVATSTPLMPR